MKEGPHLVMCRNGHTTCGWQLAQPSLVLFSFFSLFFPKAPELWIAPSLRNWSEPIPFFSSSSIVLSTRWKKEPPFPDSLVVVLFLLDATGFLAPFTISFLFLYFLVGPHPRDWELDKNLYIFIYTIEYTGHTLCVLFLLTVPAAEL
jgi:hypothetical protein